MIDISRESEINLINILIDQDIISGNDLVDIKKTFPEPIEIRRVRLPANYNILHMACETENFDINIFFLLII